MRKLYILFSLCALVFGLVISAESYALPYYRHGNVYHYHGDYGAGYHYYTGYRPGSTVIYGVPLNNYNNDNESTSTDSSNTGQQTTTCTLQEKCYPNGDCNQVQVCK